MEQMEIIQLREKNLKLSNMLESYKKKLHIAIQALNELEMRPDRRVASRCKEYLANQDF
tara:strand:- start:2717 stop:2893 length:177 start_codon:yes stop_codon:yes gene_type:complete